MKTLLKSIYQLLSKIFTPSDDTDYTQYLKENISIEHETSTNREHQLAVKYKGAKIGIIAKPLSITSLKQRFVPNSEVYAAYFSEMPRGLDNRHIASKNDLINKLAICYVGKSS